MSPVAWDEPPGYIPGYGACPVYSPLDPYPIPENENEQSEYYERSVEVFFIFLYFSSM